MKRFKEILPEEINANLFDLIGKDYALITVNDDKKINMMTASWGFFGVMWNKKVVNIVVRPSRYTYDYLTNGNKFTLNFLEDGNKDIYAFCGSKSGKDYDKVSETGLEPIVLPDEQIIFSKSKYALTCKILYKQNMNCNNFLDEDLGTAMYPNEDVHTMFIAEIEKVYKKIC